MRLLIEFESLAEMSYHRLYKHTIQGYLYSLLERTNYRTLHDSRHFKFFTFSDVFPLGDLRPGTTKKLLVSSPNPNLIQSMHDASQKNPESYLESLPIRIMKSKIIKLKFRHRLTTGSPIVLYQDNAMNVYFSFKRGGDLSFFLRRLEENAVKKFNSYYQTNYKFEGPLFDKIIFSKEVAVKNVKDGKEFIVIGTTWKVLEKTDIKGEDQRFYDFIMECGLGEKNSMGFGFLNPIR